MKKLTALCLTLVGLFALSSFDYAEAQQRTRDADFITPTERNKPAVEPETSAARVSGRCAQLTRQVQQLAARKTKLLGRRNWTVLQSREIARNFGEAEKNLAISMKSCRRG